MVITPLVTDTGQPCTANCWSYTLFQWNVIFSLGDAHAKVAPESWLAWPKHMSVKLRDFHLQTQSLSGCRGVWHLCEICHIDCVDDWTCFFFKAKRWNSKGQWIHDLSTSHFAFSHGECVFCWRSMVLHCYFMNSTTNGPQYHLKRPVVFDLDWIGWWLFHIQAFGLYTSGVVRIAMTKRSDS